VLREALVRSALDSARRAEEIGLAADRIVISCKVSGVQDLILVYRDLAQRCRYALHLGLTEAGMGSKGIVASSAALSVLLPLIFGTLAAVVFHAKFPGRGFLRGVFIMPMMATPVAIALVWTMMFHPQLGVLNFLLSLVGLPPQLWVFHPATVIPSLVLVETWQWTPLVMLIVLGGLAAIPIEPYESAQIDGAGVWQMFRYITLPLITPFLFIAGMIRMIDAVKSFDIIFAITQGGPGSASETINLYLYSVAFIYYDLGYGSAIAVVFFLLIIAMAAMMLHLRQRTLWTEIGGGA